MGRSRSPTHTGEVVPRGVAGSHPPAVTRRRVSVLLILAVLGASFFYAAHARGAGRTPCERFAAASAQRAEQVTGSGERVVVVGDSWSAGLGLDRPVQSWPARLPGQIHVAGFSGSGFSAHASVCGRVSFADRAPRALKSGADLVVVEGGLNDVDRSRGEIKAGFVRLLRVASAYRVVVVGPATAPSRAAAVPRVDRLLRHLSDRAGVAYVSTSDLDLPYLEDGLHLTVDGHRTFGDAVASRIAALG
jgi:acyl-CoA thioesterase I